MNREQVKELFKFISHIYPNFEVSSGKLDTWTRLLKHQNPAKVMMRAERHAVDNKFPPVIADLAVRKLESDSKDHLERVKQWEREAVGKP